MAKKPEPEKPVPGLYLLSPTLSDAGAFAPLLQAALEAADVACVLLNVGAADPGAAKKIIQTLAPLAQGRGAALLLDCEPRIVSRTGADGVHLRVSGETLEPTIAEAIESLKPDHIVGVGGIRTRHDAMSAGEADIDYILFGEPAKDSWVAPFEERLEKVEWWSDIFNVPCVAYAGALAEVAQFAAAGADFIALGDAIWSDPRGPAAALREAAAAVRSGAALA